MYAIQLVAVSSSEILLESVRLKLQFSQKAFICSSSFACADTATSAQLYQLVSLTRCLQRRFHNILAVATGVMTSFKVESELEQYLSGINPLYVRYTEGLWANEVTSTSQLGNASVTSMLICGIRNPIHAEDIIAQSKPAGKRSSTSSGKCLDQLFSWLLGSTG